MEEAPTQVNHQLYEWLAIVNAEASADIINETSAKARKENSKKERDSDNARCRQRNAYGFAK